MLKAAIVLMLLATIASLFSGLVFLVKDDENSTRLLKALTVRVTLAALTIGLVAWGLISGQLVSHAPFLKRSPTPTGFRIHNT
ncbi:twin transmembrane helix small protein [Pseudomonas putida]|nr:twin transmembrane helix small protein [Pseudomonas putida]ULL04235.1 twin transmembrane helix small protein [Pseudomonas putida]